MPRTTYKDLDEIDNLQIAVLEFSSWWVKNKKTPIPRKSIMEVLFKTHINRGSAEAAISALILKGYIRKAYTISNKTTYVMLRTI